MRFYSGDVQYQSSWSVDNEPGAGSVPGTTALPACLPSTRARCDGWQAAPQLGPQRALVGLDITAIGQAALRNTYSTVLTFADSWLPHGYLALTLSLVLDAELFRTSKVYRTTPLGQARDDPQPA